MKAKIIVFLLLFLFVSVARPVYIEPFPDRFSSLTIDGTVASFGDGTNDFTLTFDGGNDSILKWWEDEETLNLQTGGASKFERYQSRSVFLINDKSDETSNSRIGFSCYIEATAAPSAYLAGFFGGYRDSGASALDLTGKAVYACGGSNYFNGTNARTVTDVYAGWFNNYIEGTSNNLTIINAYGGWSKGIDICDSFSTNNLDVTNSYGYYIANAESANFANAVIVNNYGLYIEEIKDATTINRAIYSAGGDSVHAGKFRFGDVDAPTYVIDINAPSDTFGLRVAGEAAAIETDACDVLYVSGPTGGAATKTAAGGVGSRAYIAAGDGGAGSAEQIGGDGGNVVLTAGTAGSSGGSGAGTAGIVIINGDANVTGAIYYATDVMYPVKTVVKTIDVDDDASTDDFQFDDDVADQAEQSVDLGEIIPAYAEVLSAQVRCFETVTGSAVMAIDLGTASGGAEVLATANTDSANNLNGTGAGDGPEILAANAAKHIWINATPGANWNTLDAGRWAVMITYIDYGAVYTWKNP